MSKPSKEDLAQMLRDFPTWGHAAVAYREQRDEALRRTEALEKALLPYRREHAARWKDGRCNCSACNATRAALAAVQEGEDG